MNTRFKWLLALAVPAILVGCEPPPVDVGQVEYRNNLYIVEQTGEEDFVVLRQDRTEVNPKSPLAKAVVKRFRK